MRGPPEGSSRAWFDLGEAGHFAVALSPVLRGSLAGQGSRSERMSITAVRDAVAGHLSRGRERGQSAADLCSVLESVLQVMTDIINDRKTRSVDPERPRHPEEREPRRHKKFSSLACLAEGLMLAIGFVEEASPVGRLQSDYVLPEDMPLTKLLAIQLELRQTVIHQAWEPLAEGKDRLGARLSHLSAEQLSELLVCAALRDSSILRSTEALLSQVDDAPWASLPDLVVSRIAMLLQGAAGLAWCGCCAGFRGAQPAVHELCISTAAVPDEGRFRVSFSSGSDGALAHRIIESISARHARELTHLHVSAWHVRAEAPLLLSSDDDGAHGARLIALHTLDLRHMPAGWMGRGEDEAESALGSLAADLIRNVAPSLRHLRVDAHNKLHTDDMLALLPDIGPNLHSLSVELVRRHSPGKAAGDPADTDRLLEAALLHCQALRTPARIVCHHDAPSSPDDDHLS